MNSPIYIASDHAGLPLKTYLLKANADLNFKDLGPENSDSVDYPDYAHKLIKQFLSCGDCKQAVLICGSGQGMAMTANKYPEIRAALCWDTEIAKLSREHNNANVLCLGARNTSPELGQQILETFLTTNFEGGRHKRRVDKIRGDF